jgi:(1->4)-alpha-D-glucan 1-alpha-D-glucosylmutase
VAAFAAAVITDEELMAGLNRFCTLLAGPARVAVLGQKLVQLAMPGVPDVYQGCELTDSSLVDPDNRRDVDFPARRDRLTRLDAGNAPADLDDEKLLVTSRLLRLRREHPDWFVGPGASYLPIPTSSGNAVAFARGGPAASDGAAGPPVVAVATRLPVALARRGGWGEHTVALPGGPWQDLLSGTRTGGGPTTLAGLLDALPVAVLLRCE